MSSPGPRTPREGTRERVTGRFEIGHLSSVIWSLRKVSESIARRAQEGRATDEEKLLAAFIDRAPDFSTRIADRKNAVAEAADRSARRLDRIWSSLSEAQRERVSQALASQRLDRLDPTQFSGLERTFIEEARESVRTLRELGAFPEDYDMSYFPAPPGRSYRVHTPSGPRDIRVTSTSQLPDVRALLGATRTEDLGPGLSSAWTDDYRVQTTPGQALRSAAFSGLDAATQREIGAFSSQLADLLMRAAESTHDQRLLELAHRVRVEAAAQREGKSYVIRPLMRLLDSIYASPRFDRVTRFLNATIGPLNPGRLERVLFRWAVASVLAVPITALKDILGTSAMQATPGQLRSLLKAFSTYRRRDRQIVSALYGTTGLTGGRALQMVPEGGEVGSEPAVGRYGTSGAPGKLATFIAEDIPHYLLTGTRAADQIGGHLATLGALFRLAEKGYRPGYLISVRDGVDIGKIREASARYSYMTTLEIAQAVETAAVVVASRRGAAPGSADARAELVAELMVRLEAVDRNASRRWQAAMEASGVAEEDYAIIPVSKRTPKNRIVELMTDREEGWSHRIPVGGTLERAVHADTLWRVFYHIPFFRAPISITHPGVSRWLLTFWNWAFNYTMMSLGLTRRSAGEAVDLARGRRMYGTEPLETEIAGRQAEIVSTRHLPSPSIMLTHMATSSFLIGGLRGVISSLPPALAMALIYEIFIGPATDDPESLETKLGLKDVMASYAMAPVSEGAKRQYVQALATEYGFAQFQALLGSLIAFGTGGDPSLTEHLTTGWANVGPWSVGRGGGTTEQRLRDVTKVVGPFLAESGLIANFVAPVLLQAAGLDPSEFGARRYGGPRAAVRALWGYSKTGSGDEPLAFLFSWSPQDRGEVKAGSGVLRGDDPAAMATMLMLAIRERNEAIAEYERALERLKKGEEGSEEELASAQKKLLQSAVNAAEIQAKTWEQVAASWKRIAGQWSRVAIDIAEMEQVSYDQMKSAIEDAYSSPIAHMGFIPAELGTLYGSYFALAGTWDQETQMADLARDAIDRLVEAGAITVEQDGNGNEALSVDAATLDAMADEYYYEAVATVVEASGLKEVIQELSESPRESDRKLARRLRASALISTLQRGAPSREMSRLGFESVSESHADPGHFWRRIFRSAVRKYLRRNQEEIKARLNEEG